MTAPTIVRVADSAVGIRGLDDEQRAVLGFLSRADWYITARLFRDGSQTSLFRCPATVSRPRSVQESGVPGGAATPRGQADWIGVDMRERTDDLIPFAVFAQEFPAWARDTGVAGNGCWVWARPMGWGGYATARKDGRRVTVHRYLYEWFVGPVPTDRPQLDHLCRVRHCINPGHLEPVTAAENIKRGAGPAEQSARLTRTHCANGHEYTAETTSLRGNGRYGLYRRPGVSHTVSPPRDVITEPLFGTAPVSAEPAEKMSADQRRTAKQRALVDAGIHPLTRRRVHDEADRKCGNCYFRRLLDWHNKSYPKCLNERTPQPTHGTATDVRAWWPACTEHSYGDPTLSPDAARYVPEVVSP